VQVEGGKPRSGTAFWQTTDALKAAGDPGRKPCAGCLSGPPAKARLARLAPPCRPTAPPPTHQTALRPLQAHGGWAKEARARSWQACCWGERSALQQVVLVVVLVLLEVLPLLLEREPSLGQADDEVLLVVVVVVVVLEQELSLGQADDKVVAAQPAACCAPAVSVA